MVTIDELQRLIERAGVHDRGRRSVCGTAECRSGDGRLLAHDTMTYVIP
ncbi:MAG TPA: hypothetical protein VLU46_02020 [Thermoanaerobaculia bacterium]|nr:hypothetical protein [Thermoanaerobaculia bacterium]